MSAVVHVDRGTRSASLSTCGRYRYALERSTGTAGPSVAWVMLNPSTADADLDDPTIRKVVGFSRLHCFGVALVVNLWAFRATDPRDLRRALAAGEDVEGPWNRQAVEEAFSISDVVVCAWGAQPWARAQASRVLGWLGHTRPLVSLGTSKDGSPRHPLMVPYAQPLVPFVDRGEP